jgi:hypothetical protein
MDALCCGQQMQDIAALERALGIYTSEYPPLNGMLEAVRRGITLKVFILTLHTQQCPKHFVP